MRLYTARMVDQPGFADQVLQTLGRALPDCRVIGLWLYGSHASGRATPRSDVDLAVLADRRLDPLAVGAAGAQLERIAGSRVDLVDLRAASGLLRVQATHQGRLIAAPDRLQADLFATHALSDHAAFAANRRMCTEAMKAGAVADDVLMQKLASIHRCVQQVRTFVGADLDRLKDALVQDAVVLNLQRACEQAIDAASRVVAMRGLGIPADSAEAFTLLERAGVLTGQTAARMRAMVGFRNVAVHQYQSLDQAILRAVVDRHLIDFEALCRELAEA